MSQQISGLYEFGPFRLDRRERLLTRDGAPVSLTPKAFDLLLALVEGHGRLLSKEALFQTVWPDSFVEESNLSSNIALIRKALGDGISGERYIETVPKRGYRFIAQVKVIAGNGASPVATTAPNSPEPVPASPPAEIAAPVVQRRSRKVILVAAALLLCSLIGVGLYARWKPEPRVESLAVLPFSANAQTEYLADGITESLINNLSRLANLRVVARATAFTYKGKEANPRHVGQSLNVGAVLTGRVALRDDTLTVQVDLVDAATGAQVWGERYQRKLADIFAVEEEIGQQIAEKLRLRLSGAEQRQLSKRYTDDAEVYQLYLQGLYHFGTRTAGGIHRAVDYYRQALAKDPNFAPAYPALANCYVTLSADEAPNKLLPEAKAAALRALALDNELAAAHSTLAWIKWIYELDAAGAESGFNQALKLNPNSGDARYRYARLLADTGRFDEAQAQARQAVALDPLAIQYRKGLPYIHYFARRYDEAIAEYNKVIEMAPGFHQAQRELGLAYEQKGMYEEAFSQLQKTIEMAENYAKTMTQADLGHLYAAWGKRAEAGQVLSELLKQSAQRYVSAYDIAVIYAGLDEREQAFRWLNKAIEQRPFWLCWLKLDPRLDGLRTDARFRDLLRRVGQTR